MTVCSPLMILTCLTRVQSVDDFDLSYSKGDVLARFTVTTNIGTIDMEKEVNII